MTAMPTSSSAYKVVILGQRQSGKTSLVMRHVRGTFPDGHVPPSCDLIQGERFGIQDTSEESYSYERMREANYGDTDVVVVCFKLSDEEAPETVPERWRHEIDEHLQGKPIILVGTMADLEHKVSESQGQAMADEMGAVCYRECSSLTGQGVDDVFDQCYFVCYHPYTEMCELHTNIKVTLLMCARELANNPIPEEVVRRVMDEVTLRDCAPIMQRMRLQEISDKVPKTGCLERVGRRGIDRIASSGCVTM
eukprot:TRINITY_DN3059_c0_g1_i1.p2 TRINITY_DN3059_c0_g1~~TRINITY_DN3059_c0_g1_i1.p2  ORF type:complete len:251 (-),score=99.46 TRINITY_DN3059_c0_g1_i1:155-907(-)